MILFKKLSLFKFVSFLLVITVILISFYLLFTNYRNNSVIHYKDWSTFNNKSLDNQYPKYGYTIQLPKEWQVSDFAPANGPSSSVTIKNSKTQSTLIVTVYSINALNVANAQMNQFKAQGKSYTVNGYSGYRISNSQSDSVVLWHPSHDSTVTLWLDTTNTTPQISAQNDEEIFNKILSTFYFAN